MECQKVCAAGPNDGQTMSGKKNPFCLLPLCGHFPRLSPAAFAKHYHEFVWGTKSLFCLPSTFSFLFCKTDIFVIQSEPNIATFSLSYSGGHFGICGQSGFKARASAVSPSKRLCDTDKDSLAKRWPPLLPPPPSSSCAPSSAAVVCLLPLPLVLRSCLGPLVSSHPRGPPSKKEGEGQCCIFIIVGVVEGLWPRT